MLDTGVDPDRESSAAKYDLQGLNTFVDDRVRQPEFFNFRQLPIEIRYKVYEQYFLDNEITLSSRSGPVIDINTEFVHNCHFGPVPGPFASNLCLVNRTSRTEVTAFITRFATFSTDHKIGTMRLIDCLQRLTLTGEPKTLESTRKLSLRNLNGCSTQCVGKDEESQAAREAQSKETCEYVAQILPKFTGIRTLDLEFRAPVFSSFSVF
ncbi:hypothetical protein BKA63DRAFT_564502 [Paraphoma chrysanthemicola]|nr:hypothetical protein BKA63DRAFT_564502 [Paraphoma chrysanthemicola]